MSFVVSEEAAKKIDKMAKIFNITKSDYVDIIIMASPPNYTDKEIKELYKIATSRNAEKITRHAEIKQNITKNKNEITEEITIKITRSV